MEVDELNRCLAKFYVFVRKTDGSYYKKTSLFSIKAALDRYLKAQKCIKENFFFILFSRIISIYTLSDLGDLSNLIGSLSRTIQQYSPPSEWIMCELGVFPIFLQNDLLKVDKILRLTFFKARKDLEGFKTAFFNIL